ncbi:NADPH:quinone reductase [Haloarcula laminariae]|uniref:NADPH:quinone reductase n=1 Tax=Haloarcula laminariae TaxID=2961577 RepID=UPI0021C74A96|nr:NADPH:quinone reductase [Halomicroarcula laminariae]
MRAIRFHNHGGPDVLTLEEVDTPEPGPGEVRIDAEAIGVNPVDTYFREGEYPVPDRPFVPGSDVAGTVAAVGQGVTDLSVGDRVYATGLGNGRPGTYAESCIAPADFVAPLPESVSEVDGAALSLVGMTAWQVFVHHAGVEPAETVLVHGGSGGVGHVAVQLAKTMGARVVTTASETYHDRLADLGADVTIDYHADDLEERIVAAGEPAVILDTFIDEYLQTNANVAAQNARIVGIGNRTEQASFDAIGAAKGKELSYQFMTMYNTQDKHEVLSRLAALADRGEVLPEVHRTYDLADAADAQRAVMDESFLGKLVLEP